MRSTTTGTTDRQRNLRVALIAYFVVATIAGVFGPGSAWYLLVMPIVLGVITATALHIVNRRSPRRA